MRGPIGTGLAALAIVLVTVAPLGRPVAISPGTEEFELGDQDVVFYKAGRTEEGRSATAGHTASVAGDYAVCENALAQAGAFVAADFSEFTDFLRVTLPLRGRRAAGVRLAAISNAGFETVGMADSIRRNGAELVLPAFGARTEEALAKIVFDHGLDGLVDVRNPFDITPMTGDTAYADMVAEVLAEDGRTDAAVDLADAAEKVARIVA